jgi:hypothetical protein
MKKKCQLANSYLISLYYFQAEIAKFLLYSTKNLFKTFKKIMKIKKNKEFLVINSLERIKEINVKKIEKFKDVGFKMLADLKLENISNISIPVLKKDSENYRLSFNLSFFNNCKSTEKLYIVSNPKNKFKETTKIKLAQKRKHIYFPSRKINKISNNNLNPVCQYLDFSKSFYKIPISYFSSYFFESYFNKECDFENKTVLNLFLKKTQKENFIPNLNIKKKCFKNITNSFNYSNKSSKKYFSKKLSFLKRILFKMFDKVLLEKNLKNFENTIFIILNIVFIIEKFKYENLKNKILNILNLYEYAINYTIHYKQFTPYGDIYCFFSGKDPTYSGIHQ